MSIKHRFFSFAALAIAIFALSTFVSAQNTTDQTNDGAKKQRKFERKGERGFGKEMGGGKHFGGDRMLMRGLHRLNLTDAQKEQVRSLTEVNRTANKSLFEELRSFMQKRRGNETLTETEQARMTEIRTQLKASAEQTKNSILAILTPEQRSELERMQQEMKERKQNRQSRKNTQQTGIYR